MKKRKTDDSSSQASRSWAVAQTVRAPKGPVPAAPPAESGGSSGGSVGSGGANPGTGGGTGTGGVNGDGRRHWDRRRHRNRRQRNWRAFDRRRGGFGEHRRQSHWWLRFGGNEHGRHDGHGRFDRHRRNRRQLGHGGNDWEPGERRAGRPAGPFRRSTRRKIPARTVRRRPRRRHSARSRPSRTCPTRS